MRIQYTHGSLVEGLADGAERRSAPPHPEGLGPPALGLADGVQHSEGGDWGDEAEQSQDDGAQHLSRVVRREVAARDVQPAEHADPEAQQFHEEPQRRGADSVGVGRNDHALRTVDRGAVLVPHLLVGVLPSHDCDDGGQGESARHDDECSDDVGHDFHRSLSVGVCAVHPLGTSRHL